MRILTSLGVALFAGPVLAQTHLDGPGSPAAGPASKIWSGQTAGGQLWFRRSFTSKPVKSASLVISCDDQFTVHVNGRQIAHEIDWERIVIVDVTTVLRDGVNTIAVHGIDNGGSSGLTVWVTWEDATGTRQELVTDESWRVTDAPGDGWEKPEFDDRAWRPAAVIGETPYGKNVHGMEPRERVYRTLLTESVDDLEESVKALRAAKDLDAAMKALDRLEQALMEARRDLWEQRRKAKGK